jgi:hypothetical protein
VKVEADDPLNDGPPPGFGEDPINERMKRVFAKEEIYREALAQIEEILYDDLVRRPTETARKKVMHIVAKALYG